jgi:ABC-type uncharacterized transport system ATPase subunit
VSETVHPLAVAPRKLAGSAISARQAVDGDAAADLTGICKSFYGAPANSHVDFSLRCGEVHALLGENGAGKSTLCSILAGLYQPDQGQVVVAGERRRFRSPYDALSAGVGMVYQHYRLVDDLTVAENLALGQPGLSFRVSRAVLEGRARDLMARYGIHVQLDAYVGDLSVGEQQRIEILKLLAREVDILILDEPTAVLTPHESEALFEVMRALARERRSVVFISHKLNEVLAVCDRITVLRRGELVGTIEASDADRHLLARMMVGGDDAAELAEVDPATEPAADRGTPHSRPRPSGPPALRVRGLHVLDDRAHPAVRDVDLDVACSELVGVAGVAGNGQRELGEAIAGIRPAERGDVAIAGEDVTALSARSRAARGLGFVPEDRLASGVASGLSLDDNLILRGYRRPSLSRGPFLRPRAIAREVADRVREFDIRGAQPGLPIRIMSGGNVQRAILAREMSAAPRLLVAAAPTRGLDVGATASVRALLREQCAREAGVLLFSEDLDELISLCDRIVVVYEGRIVGAVTAPTGADRERLGLMMAGADGGA